MLLSPNSSAAVLERAESGVWPWPYFTAQEMACRHCGQGYHWPHFMAVLHRARSEVGLPFRVLSAHRCALHNARVGGAPLSQHLKLAVDISLSGHDKRRLYAACYRAGFTGFGYYSTFLHVDLGRRRHWFGNQKARTLWTPLLD